MANISMQRKLRAIFSADVKGYSKLMGEDDEHTINTITEYRKIIIELIETHHGRVVDAPGDNILAEFSGAINAVNSAIEIQKELESRNSKLPDKRRMDFRIGINLGDIVHREERIYGDGVNVAARIESLAEPGGICISRGVFDQVKRKVKQGFEYLGEHNVKNILEPVRIYRVLLTPKYEGKVIGEPVRHPAKIKKLHIVSITLILLCSAALLWLVYPRQTDIEPASVDKMSFPLPDKPSIAVLPFVNISGDPDQDYLSDGISEAIIGALSNIPRFFVIARNSSFTYKGKSVKIQQVAEELGVQYVLEGSVQRSGDMLRVTAQLIDALKGYHLWSERYDFKVDDLLAVQDKIALSVIVEAQVKLTEGEQVRLLKKETSDLKAYILFIHAMAYYQKTNREDMFKARQLFEEAIQIDPVFSGAYRMVSATHMWDFYRKWSQDPDRSWQLCVDYAEKAFMLDKESSPSLHLLSAIHEQQGDHDQAIALAQRAVEMTPNNASGLTALAGRLFTAGRYAETIPLQEQAGRLNPFPHASYFRNLGLYYWFTGQFGKTIAACRKALDIDPEDITTYRNMAAAYTVLGKDEEAHSATANVLRLEPDFTIREHFENMPWRDRDGMQRFMDALRRAGLPENPPLQVPDKPSIAVLPFENMSGDPDQHYFSDGITEQIITSISKVPYISVIARQSSFAFRNSEKTVQQIAEELGVKYILEGSLQRSGNQLRINAQLIDADSGHHIWAENFDRNLDDIFSMQDEICKNIMVALQVKLTFGEIARIDITAVNINAYQKYLKALVHYRRRVMDESLVARQLAWDAIAIDPDYASAYILIGWIYLDEVWFGITKNASNSISKAEEMVQKAISIRGVTAAENGLLSSIHLLKKDLEKAIFYAQESINEHPSGAAYHHILGMALRSNGQYHESIACFKRALQLNPIKSINYMNNLASAYLYSKQYEKAISTWNETIARNPDYLFAYMGLTSAYWLTGSKDQAKEAAKHVLRINPKFSVGYWEKRSYLKDKELREQLFDAWRKAGLK